MRKNFFLTASLIVLTVILSTSTIFGATAYPFPINQNYTAGIRITGANASTLISMYNTWKSQYVQTATPGRRVVSPEPINGQTYCTVSEGQAYGMLLAVYFDDQALFNDLWAYKVAKTTAAGKASNLMPWVIGSGGNVIDANSASDADFDIAFSLLMASVQWGNGGTYNYLTLGTTEVQRCRAYDISSTDYHVKPGDGWDDWSYPSYYYPAFFRVFAEVDNATVWNGATAKCYNNIIANRNATSGLVGEICTSSGARMSNNPCGGGCDGRIFKYNSCRVPFRYAMDYVWWGAGVANSSAVQTNLFASFFNGKAPASVVDGYWISSNTNEGSFNNAAFVGPAGCALMYSSTYSAQLTAYYDRTRSFNVTDSYYNGTLELMTLLLMTGNFHNLRNLGAPLPTSTQTPVPSTQLLDDFEDFMPTLNTSNNWGGYWYTWEARANLGAATNVWPGQGAFVTMTAGGSNATAPGYVAPATTYYLRVTGTKAAAVDPNYPSVGIGTELANNAEALGLSVNARVFTGVIFDARGDGTTSYKIALNPKGSTTLHPDSAFFEYTFIPPATWTHYTIPFTDFTQPTWSANLVPQTTVLAFLQKLQWQNGANVAGSFNLSLDNVGFYPFQNWTPTPVPTLTRTLTMTRTVTFTATPPITTTQLLDDCEDTNGTNNWGGPWFTYNDNAAPNNGTSSINPIPGGIFSMVAGGAATTAYSARITAVVTDVYANGFVGVGTGTNPNSALGTGINLTTATGIRFWIKGNNLPVSFKLVPGTTVNDGNDHYSQTITAPTTWTQVTLFFSDFRQEGWGTAVTLAAVKGNLAAFHWQTVGQPWASVDISIDQVEVFPNLGWTPTRTASPTASASSTRTPTRTATSTQMPNTSTSTATNSPTSTRTSTLTATSTPVPPTSTHTNTRTATPTFTRTGTPTDSPTMAPSSSSTGTRTASPTRTDTNTYTRTVTNTFTRTVTPTFTISNTHTVSPTLDLVNSATPTYTSTDSSTRTPSSTQTGTRTWTPSFTQTSTRTSTLVSTATNTYTIGSSPTFTNTVPGTFTLTRTSTLTPYISPASTATSTATRTVTPVNTPVSTSTSTATVTLTITVIVNTPTDTPTVDPSTAGLLDDVADCNNLNKWGGYWYTYNDSEAGGTSTVWPVAASVDPLSEFVMSSPGRAGAPDCAARLTGVVTKLAAPGFEWGFVAMGIQVGPDSGAPTFTTFDFSSCEATGGIKFWAKGDGKSYAIKLKASASVPVGDASYEYSFTAPAAWTQYTVYFSSASLLAKFAQPTWAPPANVVPIAQVLANITDVQFQTVGQPLASIDLWIDDIEFFGCTTYPVPPVATTPTNTPVVPTATNTPVFTSTNTPVGPTYTFTNTPVNTNTHTFTNTPTHTNTNTPTQTNTFVPISTVSLAASINAPAEATVGGQLTVIVAVNNNGTTVISNVVPNVPTLIGSTAAVVLSGGPSPASVASLAIGATTTFTWVYDVLSTGVVIVQATASGNSGVVLSSTGMSSGINLLPAPTPTATNTPVGTNTPTPSNLIEVATSTPVIIRPNPNPTPGTTPGRIIDFTVTKPITKTVFKIYTSMGRLIRKAEDTTPHVQGKCSVNVDGSYFQGLARGIYYYVIIVTDQSGKEAKSPIEKVIIQ